HGLDGGARPAREPRRPLPHRLSGPRPRLAPPPPGDPGRRRGHPGEGRRDRARRSRCHRSRGRKDGGWPGPRPRGGAMTAAPPPPLYPLLYEPLVERALAEDLGRAGDLTSDAVLPEGLDASARVVARAAGRVAGLPAALSAFRLLDRRLEVEVL